VLKIKNKEFKMATEIKPTPAGEYPLGHAKENKDASAYTGFKYPAGGGNDIGIYKQPENISVDAAIHEQGNNVRGLNISVGNVGKNAFASENPYGVKEMRGYGAATKGRKISGKQG
jgi:hypothetical protein